nr:PadR family transcriptional regulator [Halomarina sp. BND7]
MFELTGFQRDLLYVLSGFDHPSGQEIKTELETELERDITHGRLYPNLDGLVTRGYIEKGTIDRRTNYYALNEQGREALASRLKWEDTYLPFPRPVPSNEVE